MNQTIEFLLDNACPSIRYRVKKEVLRDINSHEEEELQRVFCKVNLRFKGCSTNWKKEKTPYARLALEKDWKSEKRRMCDLTFRSLLILYYSHNF